MRPSAGRSAGRKRRRRARAEPGGRAGAGGRGGAGRKGPIRESSRPGRKGWRRALPGAFPARPGDSLSQESPGPPGPRPAAADPGKERRRPRPRPPATRELRATLGTRLAPEPAGGPNSALRRAAARRTASGALPLPRSLTPGPAPHVSELRCEGDVGASPLALESWSRRLALRPCDQARAGERTLAREAICRPLDCGFRAGASAPGYRPAPGWGH